MEKLALTIAQASKLGGPCRSILYQDIRSGRLRAVKRGRSTRILIDDFRKYLASLPAIQPGGDMNPRDKNIGTLANESAALLSIEPKALLANSEHSEDSRRGGRSLRRG